MSFAPLAFTAASTALQIGGQSMSTRAEMGAADYQRQVALNNARLAEVNAVEASTTAQREGEDWGESAAEQVAAVVARQAAGGVLPGFGSAGDVTSGLLRLARRDQTRIREEGETRMRGFKQEAADFRGEASVARARKRNSALALPFQIGSSLLGGATSYRRMTA